MTLRRLLLPPVTAAVWLVVRVVGWWDDATLERWEDQP